MKMHFLYVIIATGFCCCGKPKIEKKPELSDLDRSAEIDLIRVLASHGDPKDQYELGYRYEIGDASICVLKNLGADSLKIDKELIPKDEQEAVKWYQMAAENNYLDAQIALGSCYESGRGVHKDLKQAACWYLRSAIRAYANKKSNLEYFDLQKKSNKKEKEIADLLLKSAESGDAAAQCALAYRYENGLGFPKDQYEHAKWLHAASERGTVEAQNNLGACYAIGKGVSKDEQEAVKWYRMAAEKGYALAQNNLGTCYAIGQGVPKDEQEAVKWYRMAAEKMSSEAQHSLAACYVLGQGVLKDYVIGYMWLNLAAAKGADWAGRNRDDLEYAMTPEQIAEAQKLSREWKPTPAN